MILKYQGLYDYNINTKSIKTKIKSFPCSNANVIRGSIRYNFMEATEKPVGDLIVNLIVYYTNNWRVYFILETTIV